MKKQMCELLCAGIRGWMIGSVGWSSRSSFSGHCSVTRAEERPLYDANGHYAGSVYDYGKTQTYTDRNGQFQRLCGQQRQRHHVVLRPARQLRRVGRVVDRLRIQFREGAMKFGSSDILT
jgi:hypothetical protein